ncbi:MAG: FadR family transcriptional regulator [Candidatus Atribacteria bacterium]|nr:FadR family transcriptional regulator [Candidatus Atribacteria bacterium]MCD6350015.1 FadR family transcriptional regulator [Candidatus Atribacteria bacterium]
MTRKELAITIYSQIKEGKFGGGNKLPSERELANMFSVTRTLVREALAILDAFGIIEIRDRQGIFLKEKTWREISLPLSFLMDWPLDILPQVFEARLIIEPKAAAVAAKKRTQSDLKKLKETILRAKELFEENRPDKTMLGEKWNSIFHAIVIASSHNDVLCRIHEGIIKLYERNVSSFPKENVPTPFEKWPREIWMEHASIVDAIAEGDAAEAERRAYEHVLISKERIYRFYQSPGLRFLGLLDGYTKEEEPNARSGKTVS